MGSKISAAPICSVIVAYHEDPATLKKLLNALEGRVEHTIVVVNGRKPGDVSLASNDVHSRSCTWVYNPDNIGLAAAQNQGIRLARERGANAIVFFDQDSFPPPETVAQLALAWNRLQADGRAPAAVGVSYYQGGSRQVWPGFVRIRWWGFGRKRCAHAEDIVEADFLISSGSLIPMAVLDDVGPMDGALFVDHVDTEWCLRAASKGYRLFGVCSVKMRHALGERSQRVWFGRWRQVSSHQPLRYYYMFRNSMLLYKRRYIPFAWKSGDILRSLQMLVFFGLFSSQRRQVLIMMMRGWRDGLRNRGGEFG